MSETLRWMAGLALAIGLAAPANAAPYAFNATLTLQIGFLPTVVATGSGTGTSVGVGGAASIPAGVFAIQSTASIDPPILVVEGFGVGAPGVPPLGASVPPQVPLPPGTNKALAFGGVTGTMGLSASAYLLTNGTQNIAAAIPLGIIGQGGTVMFNTLGMLIMGTIFANPYQLGMVTLMGQAFDFPTSTIVATGFDNRTAGGLGGLQLVSPTSVDLGVLGTLPAVAILTFVVPEPATVTLLAAGLALIGALGRRYTAR